MAHLLAGTVIATKIEEGINTAQAVVSVLTASVSSGLVLFTYIR